IVQFGGGCTAEMISANGLLITNHHCGYASVTALSTVEHNYLDNGFWSHSMAEELPAEGLSVIFLQNIEDVTDEVNRAIRHSSGEKMNKKLEEVIKKIEKRSNQNGKLVASVKSYFNGNQYLLLTYKKYTDVRLVATPPKSLGKFGGDTDNWIWPRHTADFSMFRVYADANNEPAEYDTKNQPYHPKWHLPVSAKGVKEGDYTMIYGYPGRTNRYEISSGVELSINETNPDIVRLRGQRLAIMKRHMDADKSVYLKLTSRYAGIANYWKYFIGQTEQLKRLKVVAEKRSDEADFTLWAGQNKEYRGLVNRYNAIYNNYAPYARSVTYYGEAFKASGLARIAADLEPLATAFEKGNTSSDTLKKYIKALDAARKSVMKEYDAATEKELLAFSAEAYYQDVPKGQLPAIYDQVIFRKFGGGSLDKTFTDYANYVGTNTFLLDSNQFKAFVAAPSLEKIQHDPAAEYAISFVRNYKKWIQPRYENFALKKAEYSKLYLKGLMEMNKGKLMYPDANSTMRITYGQVKGYYPKDGVYYEPFTTTKGVLAKYKPNDDEFDAPKEVISMIKAKDYGRWMSPDSTVHTCFITTNDITGGNSGSPVINANGEWVGAAFDGNWEAMSGDIAFDKKYKRTIVVDARYVLWLIDKLGHAENLIEEMDVRY
ncbi:MAG: S46 family peptidase, partial [Chitinophagaceae bacterium]